MNNEIVIVAAKRTPIGSFQGVFNNTTAVELSTVVTKSVIDQISIDPSEIDEAIIGCVLTAGLGQAPARQVSIASGLSLDTGAITVNKVCSSGLQSILIGNDMIKAGTANIVLAGGMESMTMSPYLMPNARQGYRMGSGEVIDHMFYDGLQNPYDQNLMGYFAEQTSKKYGFTREDQDLFSIESVNRSLRAQKSGLFDDEIEPVVVKTRRDTTTISKDEEPEKCDIDKIPSMRPAFDKNGTVTAASSSSISDGAASLIIMSAVDAQSRGLKPLAIIRGHKRHSQEPEWFTTANIGAIDKLQKELNWNKDLVDLYEINEAFACVTMAAMTDLDIDHEKLNILGGACALGHPIGASAARILITLIYALRNNKGKRGIASACNGGGEAVAIAIEIP